MKKAPKRQPGTKPRCFDMKQYRLTYIAELMGLDPYSAVYLPSCVTSIAGKLGISENDVMTKLETIEELRDYVNTVIAKLWADEMKAS